MSWIQQWKLFLKAWTRKNPEYCHMQPLKPLQAQHLWSVLKNKPPHLVAQGKLYAVSHLLVSLQSRDSLETNSEFTFEMKPKLSPKGSESLSSPIDFQDQTCCSGKATRVNKVDGKNTYAKSRFFYSASSTETNRWGVVPSNTRMF